MKVRGKEFIYVMTLEAAKKKKQKRTKKNKTKQNTHKSYLVFVINSV